MEKAASSYHIQINKQHAKITCGIVILVIVACIITVVLLRNKGVNFWFWPSSAKHCPESVHLQHPGSEGTSKLPQQITVASPGASHEDEFMIYFHPSCGWCKKLISLLATIYSDPQNYANHPDHEIIDTMKWTLANVAQPEHQKTFNALGGGGVPAVFYNKEKVCSGFSQTIMEMAIAIIKKNK